MATPCKSCGGLLAPADLLCPSCGAKVEVADAAKSWLERAEAARLTGSTAEAARCLKTALSLPLDAATASPAWQKLGVLLEKQHEETGRGGLLEEAGGAFQKAVSADGSNELAHQLWVANLARRGLAAQALVHYETRLKAAPEDSQAARMLKVAKLALEFKANPIKVAAAPGPVRKGLVGWFLKPSPALVGSLILTALSSLAMMVVGLVSPPPSAPLVGTTGMLDQALQAGDPTEAIKHMLSGTLTDPWLNGLNVLLCGAYLAYLWKARR